MRILTCELKKMLYYRYGFITLLCFFAVFTLSLALFDNAINPEAEYHSEEYNYYLDMMQGQVSDEKVDFLENESLLIAETKIALEKLYEGYYDGNITQSDFNAKLPQYQSVLENENGFEIIYNQLLYVNENTDTRYFADTNGWHALLSSHYADYVLIILVIVLIIPILCHEYNTKMNYINITTKYGSNIISKIAVSFIVVVAVSLLSSLIIYFFCDFKYVLRGGNYPLESVELFADTAKQLSLLETFVIMMIIRLVGFLLLGVLVLCVCTLLKKTSVSVFVVILITFLPDLLLSQNFKNTLPLPTTLIFNSTLFIGEKTEIDFFTKEVITVFNEVSQFQITMLIIGAILLSLLFLTISQWSNKNRFDVRRHLIMKKSRVALLMFAIMTLITGCSSVDTQSAISYNTVDNSAVQNRNYEFATGAENDFMPMFTDKKTNETDNLIRSPLAVNKQFQSALYVGEKYAYYAYYTQDKSDMRLEEAEKITFIRVDLETFEETVYFERSLTSNSKWNILYSFSDFFVSGNELYIIDSEIYKINTTFGSIELLNIDSNGNIAFDGRYIFYIGDKSTLYCYDTKDKTSDAYQDVVASSFYITDDNILYVNRKDENTLYLYNKEQNTHTRIYGEAVSFFALKNETIIVTAKNGEVEILLNNY